MLTDHSWLGDEQGHNCVTCMERDDALHLCWPQAHVCFLCEEAPCAWPDTACNPCRLDIEARSDFITDPVERLLCDHMRAAVSTIDVQVCTCLVTFRGGPALHRRHVAELVYGALGVGGPLPWEFGPDSDMTCYFDKNGRVIADDDAYETKSRAC